MLRTLLRACDQCGLLYLNGAEFCGVDGTPTLEMEGDPLIARRLGQYEVLERVGIGGVAAIYRARHVEVGHEVALKVLLGEMASRPTVAERFRREAFAACRIVHPHVVRTFDFGTSDAGAVFLAMELLEGRTLAERLETTGPLPQELARTITYQLANGLQAIHALGYVHRDVKPSNVVLLDTPDGVHAKIIDFGLVRIEGGEEPADRLTQQGTVLGTPQYMAPEVIQGDPPTPAIDLYGLGATLYEMLRGRPPFEGSLTEVLLRHVQDAPAPIEGSGELGKLALHLLAKEARDRPASASAVQAILDAPPRRPRTAAWLALAGAGLLSAGAILAFAQGGPEAPNAAALLEQPPRSEGGPSRPVDAPPASPLEAPSVGARSLQAPPLQVPSVDARLPQAPPLDAPSGDALAVEAPSRKAPSVDARSAEARPAEARSAEARSPKAPSLDASPVEARSQRASSLDAPASGAPPSGSVAPTSSARVPPPPRRARPRRAKAAPPPTLPAVLEVRIDSIPPGARVSTERGVLGLTPLSAFLPTSGATTLTVDKDGHVSQTRRWTAKAGTKLKFNLPSAPP